MQDHRPLWTLVLMAVGLTACVGEIGDMPDEAVPAAAPVQVEVQDPNGFIRVDPFRFLDTRETNALASGAKKCWTIDGVPVTATAVSLNLTAVKPQANGYLTAYPSNGKSAPVPEVSSLNYAAGQNVANGLIVPLGDGGRLCVYTSAQTHVVIDVNGYFSDASAFTALTPYRQVDTRSTKPMGAQSTRCWKVTRPGDDGVPADAVAVVVNLAAVRPDSHGFATAFPSGAQAETPPKTSSLNYGADAVVANSSIVELGADGKICVYTHAALDLVMDVYGYFGPAASYTPIAAERLMDTRGSKGGRAHPVGGSTRCVRVAGRYGIPRSANAVVVNLTAVRALENGFLRVRPAGEAWIETSTLNYATDGTRANNAIVKPGVNGEICIYARSQAHYVLDVVGYWPGYLAPDPLDHPHTFEVATTAEFLSALERAAGGDTIDIAPSAKLDLTGHRDIVIPGDVVVQGGRSGHAPGALLYTNDQGIVPAYKTWGLIKTGGENVTIKSLRLRGPDGTVAPGFMAAGIDVRHDGFELRNTELFHWPAAGVQTGRNVDGAVIDGNFIHDNIRVGRGYGVLVGSEAPTLITNNVFRKNRHAVAGSGYGSYEVAYNLFAASDSYGVHPLVDMHGVNEHTFDNDPSFQAGIDIHIHHNDFQYAAPVGSLVEIRGIPANEAIIEHNCVAQTDFNWVRQSIMVAYSSPQAGQSCYGKSDRWLCNVPKYGADLQNIRVGKNIMGIATGCRF